MTALTRGSSILATERRLSARCGGRPKASGAPLQAGRSAEARRAAGANARAPSSARQQPLLVPLLHPRGAPLDQSDEEGAHRVVDLHEAPRHPSVDASRRSGLLWRRIFPCGQHRVPDHLREREPPLARTNHRLGRSRLPPGRACQRFRSRLPAPAIGAPKTKSSTEETRERVARAYTTCFPALYTTTLSWSLHFVRYSQ